MGNKIKYLKPLALAGLVAASSSVNATTVQGKVTFTTGKEVSIEQMQGLDFGDNMTSSVGSRCSIEVPDATNGALFTYTADFKVKLTDRSVLLKGYNTSGGSPVDSGACGTPDSGSVIEDVIQSGNTKVKTGLFRITGTGSSAVTIHMVSSNDNEFLQFTPVGWALPGDVDIATGVTPGTPTATIFTNNDATNSTITLISPSGSSTTGIDRVEGDGGDSTIGYATLLVGGDLDVVKALTPGDEQNLTYTVHVVYN